MELRSKIFQYLSSNPTQSEDSFYELLMTMDRDELMKLKDLKDSIPFDNLSKAIERCLTSVEIPFQERLISQFIPETSIKCLVNEKRFVSVEEKELYENLTKEIFLHSGRIPNHERLMGHFPHYLSKHFEVVKMLFSNDLSIPYIWRYYISYMSAATHKCEYLMNLQEFYCKSLHQSWILDEIPEKLKSLGSANVKLAHRPWEFNEKDIKELLKLWNVNELILALTIICQFHCLSGFVFGLGITEESDLPPNLSREISSPVLKVHKTSITAMLKNYLESAEPDDYISDSSEDLNGEDEDVYYSGIAGGYLNYINYPMDYISRAFNASDFKFSDQAFYILEKIIPEVSESIWNRIRLAYAMTYDKIGDDVNVETAPLRRAIWNYVQRVYGLQYDDFNYTDINKFLKISTKRYIKKVACFPETVTRTDYLNIELDLSPDDMIHLNLLICEARFEAQLVYMLYSVQKAFELGLTSL